MAKPGSKQSKRADSAAHKGVVMTARSDECGFSWHDHGVGHVCRKRAPYLPHRCEVCDAIFPPSFAERDPEPDDD